MREDKTRVFNMDCMEYMKDIPDKFFELAIVDPNYGIGEDGKSNHSRSKLAKAKKYTSKNWDNQSVSKDVLSEIIRISKNQIIWGANHFISKIPFDSSCWIIWDKVNGESDFADAELAWTSFETAARVFTFRWAGMLQHDMKNKEFRIHPTQKPIKLYEWLLINYAKEGDKILDTHLGSGSSRIAAYNLGFDFTGLELDQEYFNDSVKRFDQHKKQLTLF